jgi:hypothetical protein
VRNFAQDIISSIGVLVDLKQIKERATIETEAVTMMFFKSSNLTKHQ